MVAKRRTVITLGLALRLRVSKVSTISGIAGGRGRGTQDCRHVWTCCVGAVVVAKCRTVVVTFGPALRLRVSKVSTITGIAVGRGRETQNCRHFWTCVASIFASQKCQQSYGSGGSWPRNAELSSLLDLRCVFASQKCQQSRGSQWVVVAKRRTVVTFGPALRRSSHLKSVNNHADQEGRGRETQNCRHLWTRVWSSRLVFASQSVNSHGHQEAGAADAGGPIRAYLTQEPRSRRTPHILYPRD